MLTTCWRVRPRTCRTLRRSPREGTTTASFSTAWCQGSWCREAVRPCMHARGAHSPYMAASRRCPPRGCVHLFECAVCGFRAPAGFPSARVLLLASARPAALHLADWRPYARAGEQLPVSAQTPLGPARAESRSLASTLRMNSTPISRIEAPESSGVPGGEGAHTHPNARARTHTHTARLAGRLTRSLWPPSEANGGRI